MGVRLTRVMGVRLTEEPKQDSVTSTSSEERYYGCPSYSSYLPN